MGHIFEANNLNTNIDKISNTTLPKIYEGFWNKKLTSMVLRYLKDDTDAVTSFYAELNLATTSTSTSQNINTTPYEVKGKYMSPYIDQIAVSPSGDKIFSWNIENDNGIGYISTFDEKNKVKIIDTPLTQVNIDWPASTTVTITTKGLSTAPGYMYGVNTKTAEMTKLLGNIKGLSAKLSVNSKNIFYSSGGKTIKSGIYDIKNAKFTDVIFGTLADKCVWSSINQNEMYCAVPTDIPEGAYPDDWYKGQVSFVDKIWLLDTTTGEVHLIANLLSLSNKLIDATQLTLDPKENYLYFINKKDLTLWVLDLNQ